MDLDKIKKVTNSCISILNRNSLSNHELVVSLAQLLIYTGKALYDPENKIKEIDWAELNRNYYTSKEPNIGLGLLLNGGQMMGAIDKNKLENQEKNENDKIPTNIEAAQEISRITVQSSKTRRRNTRRRKSED